MISKIATNAGPRRRVGTSAAMFVAVAVGLLAVPSQAQAVDIHQGGSIIECVVNVQNVHNSAHVTGTINVVATASCDAIMPVIDIYVQLHKVGGSVWNGATAGAINKSSVQGNSAVSCSHAPGSFFGTATAEFEPPAGYTPSPDFVTSTGSTTTITCSSAQVAGPEQLTGPAPALTVTFTNTNK